MGLNPTLGCLSPILRGHDLLAIVRWVIVIRQNPTFHVDPQSEDQSQHSDRKDRHRSFHSWFSISVVFPTQTNQHIEASHAPRISRAQLRAGANSPKLKNSRRLDWKKPPDYKHCHLVNSCSRENQFIRKRITHPTTVHSRPRQIPGKDLFASKETYPRNHYLNHYLYL